MDARVLRQISRICTSDEGYADALARTLSEEAGGAMTVSRAADGLEEALTRACAGVPQVVGAAGDAVVLISVADLAGLLREADTPTLAEALRRSGFEPYRGGRVMVGERRSRGMLKRRGDAA
ncbi:hypothetical protein M0654_12610 [Rhizobium sp. NTR19]|uniref:Uncharacterized protein n=1 Tax=Neorhizobium turbinariae TaxID=2937795 RepID=A0ABT0ISG3_9HYPH|nr:hypothetical protein [Neorhizobium turbinariae]MCK8780827.1 hypothetical protein [Neorhizobium turbinariae]